MREVSTVHLNAPIAPGGKSEARGYVERHDERGVWLNDREDGRGECTFYPANRINRVVFNTGW